MGWEPIPIILDPRWWNELPRLPNLVAQIAVQGGDNSRVEDGGVAWISDPAQGVFGRRLASSLSSATLAGSRRQRSSCARGCTTRRHEPGTSIGRWKCRACLLGST